MKEEKINSYIKVLIENKWDNVKSLNLYDLGIILRELQQERDELKNENRDLRNLMHKYKTNSDIVDQKLSNKEAIIKEAREQIQNAGVNTLMGGHKDKLLTILDKEVSNE